MEYYLKKLDWLEVWIAAKVCRAILDTKEMPNFKIYTYGPEIWSFDDYCKTQTGEIKLYA